MGNCDRLAIHDLRLKGQADQAAARREADLQERETVLRERSIASRERWQADLDSVGEDAPSEELTFDDFGQEVTLADVERIPAALERNDGETLLYEGLANTIFGEPSSCKSFIGLMAVIQRLQAGRRVIWRDNEDTAKSLASRLQVLKATNLIGCPDLAFVTGDMHLSETAMAGALAFLDFDAYGPGLVVIDSATSFGCPKDGADVAPWVKAHIKPWIEAGHTTLLIDHVPKQRKDRPAGAVGSFEKLSDIRGAALYVHGTGWNRHQGGAVHLTIHKDGHGQLPAPKFSVAATVSATWNGPVLDWTIDLPNAKDEAEDLQMELMDAIEEAGPSGVKGSRAIRDLLKGKRARDIDAARNELESAGMIQHVKVGNTHVYTVVK